MRKKQNVRLVLHKSSQKAKKEKLIESREDIIAKEEAQEQPKPKIQPIRVEQKVGRNDPCPCGSGKKFKNCHGQGQ